MIASLLAFVVLAAPQPGFCESLKTVAAAKDFRYNGPLASVRIPGAQSAQTDAQRGYFAVLGAWPLDPDGEFDPRDEASLLERLKTVTADVATCFPDWAHATIVESQSRPELVGGSAFFKEGRTIEVQVYDGLHEGFKLRIQVLAPGALAAPTKQARDLCPTLNQVIAAQGISSDFAPLKKSPVTPPGARSSRVIETPRGAFYEADFGEFAFTGQGSPAQKKEILESLQSLTVDVTRCISPSEWTALQLPRSYGDLGAVEFTRGRTLVKVWGYITKVWDLAKPGKPEDFNSSVKVVLIVRENKSPR